MNDPVSRGFGGGTVGARGASVLRAVCAAALVFLMAGVGAVAAEPVVEEPAPLVPPTVVMPPPPGEREDQDVWAEADLRAQRLKEAVEQEIAAAVPGPPPPPKSKPEKKPIEAKPTAARGSEARPETPSAEAETATQRSRSAPAPAPAAQPAGGGVPELELVEKFTTSEGLPHEIVSAIFVDETDAWIGTSGGGVGRYNFAEKNWIVTKEVDGLASDHVTDIAKFKGRVYVGTKFGLSVWDGFSWTTTKEFKKVQLLNVGLTVRGGELWVAARNMRGGVLLYDGEKWTDKTTMRGGVLLNNISDIVFDGEDMWMGTTSRGVSVLRGKKWTDYSVVEGIASNFVYTLGVIKGRCFLGGCCGLSYFDGGKWTIYDIPDGLAHSTVNAIETEGGLVWLGTKNGLSVFDGEEFHNFFVEDGLLVDNRVTSLFIAGEELWVGVVGGLSRLRKSY